jgi:hypothetical protein
LPLGGRWLGDHQVTRLEAGAGHFPAGELDARPAELETEELGVRPRGQHCGGELAGARADVEHAPLSAVALERADDQPLPVEASRVGLQAVGVLDPMLLPVVPGHVDPAGPLTLHGRR